jgi:hypothetical protein
MGVCLLEMCVVQVGTSRADLSARRPLLSVCVCALACVRALACAHACVRN